MATDKIDELYDALRADGIVEKSRDNFRNYMLAPGKEGYANRKNLYDALKADDLVSSASYEDFRDNLGLRPNVQPEAVSSGTQSVQRESSRGGMMTAEEAEAASMPGNDIGTFYRQDTAGQTKFRAPYRAMKDPEDI